MVYRTGRISTPLWSAATSGRRPASAVASVEVGRLDEVEAANHLLRLHERSVGDQTPRAQALRGGTGLEFAAAEDRRPGGERRMPVGAPLRLLRRHPRPDVLVAVDEDQVLRHVTLRTSWGPGRARRRVDERTTRRSTSCPTPMRGSPTWAKIMGDDTVRLRDVEDADLEVFLEYEHDPEAVRRSGSRRASGTRS